MYDQHFQFIFKKPCPKTGHGLYQTNNTLTSGLFKLVNSVTSCFNTLQNKTIGIRHNTIGRIQVIVQLNKCQVSNEYQA